MIQVTQAVILAGGRGERLRPLTDSLPKPMVPMHGKPFMEYLVELLKQNGVEEIVMLLGYLPEKVMEYFGDGSRFGVRVRYSVGAIEDETGTRIRNAFPFLREKFFLLYCDNYWPMQGERMRAHYAAMDVPALVTVYRNSDGRGEYGFENNMTLAPDGYATRYDRSRKDPTLNGTDIGFYILDRRIVSRMPPSNFSFEEVMLPQLIGARELCGYWAEHRYFPLTSIPLMKTMERVLAPRKVALLDRDGVVNRKAAEHDYIKRWSEFEFLPGAIEALQTFTQKGYELYLVSNQRGIARGLMSETDLAHIHGQMATALRARGVELRGIYHCPHADEAGCFCRKPSPGLLYRAASDHAFDVTRAIMIGDGESDMEAGRAAGCATMKVDEARNLLDIARTI